MLDCDETKEKFFFDLFQEYFDSEKDAGKQHDPANYSLERMRPLAELAGHPERKLRVVHVAGTKGKGTTSAFVAAMLQTAGKKTGLFCSPHLRTVRERFQEDGRLLEYERLQNAGEALVKKIRAIGLQPSLFEIFTVLALQVFAEDGMEYAVMETGIGGRLDSTNYIPEPAVTIITPVSYDHMALLGNTVEEIAGEKAGILKRGVPLVLARQPYGEARAVILGRAMAQGCPVVCAEDGVGAELSMPSFPKHYPPFLKENFLTARLAVRELGIVPEWERFVFPSFRARFEVIRNSPLVMLDAAHNGDSMERLVEGLLAEFPGVEWTVVLGCVKGKDVTRMAAALRKLRPARFVLTNPQTGKGSALSELELQMHRCGLPVVAVIPDLKEKGQLPQNGNFLFTGSFFTALIGERLFRS